MCLFDKTGTITTDELVAAGGLAWPLASAAKAKGSDGPPTLGEIDRGIERLRDSSIDR